MEYCSIFIFGNRDIRGNFAYGILELILEYWVLPTPLIKLIRYGKKTVPSKVITAF